MSAGRTRERALNYLRNTAGTVSDRASVPTPRRPLHDVIERALRVWRAVLDQQGYVLVRQVPLPSHLNGLTHFPTGSALVAEGLNDVDHIEAVTHELLHLLRGPVAESAAEAEELEVRRETARVLLPDLDLPGPPRSLTEDDLEMLATSHGVNADLVEVALFERHTGPIPKIAPEAEDQTPEIPQQCQDEPRTED